MWWPRIATSALHRFSQLPCWACPNAPVTVIWIVQPTLGVSRPDNRYGYIRASLHYIHVALICFGSLFSSKAVVGRHKLQALVHDILPSTTAVFSYAIGSTKLSANEQFFVGAQTVVSLLQTTQIKQGVSFIAANKVYTSTNNPTIVCIETELFFTRGGCVSCLRACLGARLLLQSY